MRIQEILNATTGILINGNLDWIFNGKFKTNSAEIEAGDCFIAINSGHNFIKDAKNRGASLIICNNDFIDSSLCVIKVQNTIDILLKLASLVRNKYLEIPVVAITGSVGKTTTKELIYQILSSQYKVLKSEGNKNNKIGMSETIFRLSNNYDICILEMGMNHLGEISELSKTAKPNAAIITNIGTSHIGFLKSQKNIFKAKSEILHGLIDGVLFINGDDKFLKKIKYRNTIKAGTKRFNDLIAYNILTTKENLYFKINYNNRSYHVRFNIPNEYLIPNILISILVGLQYNIPIENIINKIESYKSYNHRNEIIQLPNNTIIIDDCYNASIESIVSGLSLLNKYEQDKIIIIGDVLELGKFSRRIHQQIGKRLDKEDALIILVGNEVKNIKNNKFIFKNNHAEVIDYLKGVNLGNKVIYIKGSRKMKLEEVKTHIEGAIS